MSSRGSSRAGNSSGENRFLAATCLAEILIYFRSCETIDLAGNFKFGPDVEHLFAKGTPDGRFEARMEEENTAEDPDWWQAHLTPSAQRKEEMARAIRDYVSIACNSAKYQKAHGIPYN